MENLSIYEIDYSVSPGGINSFEIYDNINDIPLYETPSLTEACLFAYNLGRNFTVYTLSQYHKEFDMDLGLPAHA